MWYHPFLVLDAAAFVTGFVLCPKLVDPSLEFIGKRRVKANEAKKMQLTQDLEGLDCCLVPQEITLGNLPSRKKTIHLRFLDLKSKVCRPFAGN